MPFFTVRRNCSAAIPPAPQQDVAVKASPTRDHRVGLVVLLHLQLGNDSLRACKFAITRCDLVSAVVSSTVPHVPARMHKKLGDPDLRRPAWRPCTTTFPSNKPNEPTGFHTFSPRWKATTPPLFALGAATLSLASDIEIVAGTFERRNMCQC
jgi:hypothetical protein